MRETNHTGRKESRACSGTHENGNDKTHNNEKLVGGCTGQAVQQCMCFQQHGIIPPVCGILLLFVVLYEVCIFSNTGVFFVGGTDHAVFFSRCSFLEDGIFILTTVPINMHIPAAEKHQVYKDGGNAKELLIGGVRLPDTHR